ncbi:MAG TPA: ABC transporter permease, partial [Rhodothermales bacterium]|nr:ABC transporter permease [Rhodothermales bacterium]
MGTANQFDLEQAIATWRRFLASSQGLLPDDLDELETHLRDEFEALLADGLDPEAAYRTAQQRVGDYDTIENAYQRLYWKKVYHERRLRDELSARLSMIKNYIKIALRNLVRQKGYAFINVFGLAVGMACCLLILLFVQKERSYDRFHKHADRIYRLAYSAESGGTLTDWAYSGAPWGPALAEELPEVVATARLQGSLGDQTNLVGYGDNSYSERHLYLADPTVFEVFTLPLLQGDPGTALDAPYTIVLSETAARKYFGDQDPVGKALDINGDDFQVTGVFEALPSNSHIRLDMLASFATVLQDQPDYNSVWLYTYVLLDEPHAAETVRGKLSAFAEQHISREGFLAGLQGLYLQPLTDLHLHSHRQGEPGPGGNPATLSIFSVVAFLVLALACINFMNLSTARSAGRAREVGMRKTLGANRRQLILQFIGEAVLLCTLSVVLAVGMAWLCLPFFSTLAG